MALRAANRDEDAIEAGQLAPLVGRTPWSAAGPPAGHSGHERVQGDRPRLQRSGGGGRISPGRLSTLAHLRTAPPGLLPV
jgi:hypothetical protein